MNLQEKINLTRGIFERVLSFADHQRIYVAWTGGKDSTVALSLWAHFLEENGIECKPAAINLDTGLKFPEILAYRDALAAKWEIDLNIIKPELDVDNYPVAEDKVNCCRDLKIGPLKKAIIDFNAQAVLTGIRSDEHPTRCDRDQVEQKTDPEYFQVNPILHWTEMDIWSFIVHKNLPYCTLYDQGYTSLGCMPCTRKATGMGERSGRSREKEESLDVLRGLGYF